MRLSRLLLVLAKDNMRQIQNIANRLQKFDNISKIQKKGKKAETSKHFVFWIIQAMLV